MKTNKNELKELKRKELKKQNEITLTRLEYTSKMKKPLMM